VRWSLETLEGQLLTCAEKLAQVEPSGVTAVESLDFSSFLNDDTRRELVFTAELWQGETRLSRQTSFFVPTKHLALKNPQIDSNLSLQDGRLSIGLAARSLARLVECSLTGADVIFDDNYFDLPAQKVTTVTAPLPAGWDLAKARAAFRVRSVYDTYSK
jgi:beta-mannosidase